MQKLLLIGALLGFSCAFNVMSYNAANTYATSDGYWSFSYGYDMDWSYNTLYVAGPDPLDENRHREGFGFRTESHMNCSIDLLLGDYYIFHLQLSFIPWDFKPYQQDISYIRPEAILMDNSNYPDFDIRVSGKYNFHGIWLVTTLVQEMKTIQKSFVDFMMDTTNSPFWPDSWSDF